jgi:hypothetical protein
MIDNVLYAKREAVKVGRHTFNVHTIETHWQGDPHGKMEDMPGNFLEQTVQLTACDNPDAIEQLGVQYLVVLDHQRKETTHEPRGYAELKHTQLVKRVQTSPEQYTRNIRRAVKEKL